MKNKKGLFSFIFGLFGLFVLILVLVSLIIANQSENLPETIKVLEKTQQNLSNKFSVTTDSPISNVVYSFVNFITYSAFEVTKLAVQWGYDNPEQINPKVILYLIIISLTIPLVYYLFLFIIVLFLLIKEWFLIKKERKRFK